MRLRNAVLFLSLPLLAACAATSPAAPAARAQTPADTTRKPVPASPTEDVAKYRPVFAAPAPAGPAAAGLPRPASPTAPTSRPAAIPPPTSHVTAQVEQRLRDQAFTNQNVKYASGFRVRAYLGLERDQVMNIRRQIISRYPDETDYITFKQPVYRLYVGDYLTKLDAARGLARVRQFVPRAELEPMQVLLNKVP
ncbi:sporulation protein [Hymenobacter cheonanensis]|uniref:sporulation protein n=1 Tax=Hymenobacter sp. CA2-7 TaxID=3063993 RepID=UPI00272CB5D4|nr:sporulation protein [Hymenobacter sp. CA2-7]